MSRELKIATDFCKLVEVVDLYEYLGVSRDAPVDEAKAALAKKRKYMQAMQANPKFKDSARYLIKHYRTIDRVLDEPAAHLEAMRQVREDEVMPMLVIALDGVLADGMLTAEEERFVRKLAVDFGVSVARYEEKLKERAAFHNATIQLQEGGPGILQHANDTLDVSVDSAANQTIIRGVESHGWWDASFTRLLLECIPGGPGELIDIYCRTADAGMTLLPERRQLAYLGVDRSPERIAEARQIVATETSERVAKRIGLTTGLPTELPTADQSVDYVLAVRALANLDDTRAVFAEAMRVLRDGGRMIVAEPDGFGESFYFERNLTDYNEAFHRLVVKVDQVLAGDGPVTGRPGLAIGPSLTHRMELAGFIPDQVKVHASASFKRRRFRTYARRLRKYPQALAHRAGLTESPELAAVLRAVDALEVQIPDGHVGMSGNVLPMFVAVGIKDED